MAVPTFSEYRPGGLVHFVLLQLRLTKVPEAGAAKVEVLSQTFLDDSGLVVVFLSKAPSDDFEHAVEAFQGSFARGFQYSRA